MKKRNLVIDAHHHWMPEEHYRNPEPFTRSDESVVREPDRFRIRRGGVQLFSPPIMTANMGDQIKEMDRVGVDQAVLHVGCWLDWIDIKGARFINDKMVEVTAQFPNRVIPLAHVPPLDREGRNELKRSIYKLGFKGVGINTHVNGVLLDHKEYYSFYRTVSDLEIPIFIHPASEVPLSHPHGMEDFNLTRNLGRAFDNTINITRLMLSGTLDRFPKLRFVFTHLGGAYFALKNRLNPSFWEKRPKGFFNKYRRRIFIDTAPPFWSSEEIRFAVQMMGEGQVLMGSDFPTIALLGEAVRIIQRTRTTSNVKRKLLGENVRGLFR